MFLKIMFSAEERVERNMSLHCKCSYTFYTDIPFQCLANEFKLLFMRAFFFCVIVVFISCSGQKIVLESSAGSQVKGNASSSHDSDCNKSFLMLTFLKEIRMHKY